MKKIWGLSLVVLFWSFTSCISINPEPPVLSAVYKDNLKKVKQLVESGADINAARYGYTPLERAAARGNLEMVKYLLANNAKDPQQAFGRALENKHINIIRYLLDTGYVDVNISALSFRSILNDDKVPFEQRMQNIKELTDGKLNSPLILQVTPPDNFQKMVDFFGIKLSDRVDDLGSSILHIATRYRNIDLVRYLLENNFDVNILDNNNQTALFYAVATTGLLVDWNSPVIEDEKTAKLNFRPGDMPYYGPLAGMEIALIGNMLLNAGISINQQNKQGWTVLHFAYAYYPAGPKEYLVERGADKEIKTNFGRTAADIPPPRF